jgi:diguanylate cyclase (GGDEF)-like protein
MQGYRYDSIWLCFISIIEVAGKVEVKSYPDMLRDAGQRLKMSNIPVDEQGRVMDLITTLISSMDDSVIRDSNFVNHLIETIADHGILLMIIERQAAELDALKRITYNLTSSLDLHSVLDAVVSEALHLVKDSHEAQIHLYQDNKLTFGASLDESGTKDRQMSVPRPDGLTRTVASQKQMVIVEDMEQHPLFKNAPKPRSGSIIGIPLIINGLVVGVMNLVRTHVGEFSLSEIRLLTLLADQAAIAVNNAHLHQLASQEARRDVLTSLPNRRALDERLDEAISHSNLSGHPFSVVMMDLDGFKTINDTYGHETGDDILRQLADSLMQSLRSTDFLARYGGDEMTLVLPDTDLPKAAYVAHKLQNQLRTLTIRLPDGQTTALGVSGGIALFPKHADTAPGLLRAADEALYQAKKHARGTFVPARGKTGELPPIPDRRDK